MQPPISNKRIASCISLSTGQEARFVVWLEGMSQMKSSGTGKLQLACSQWNFGPGVSGRFMLHYLKLKKSI